MFDAKVSGRGLRLACYDTSSPDNWRLVDPHVIVICYDISQRLSLINMRRYVSAPNAPSSPPSWCEIIPPAKVILPRTPSHHLSTGLAES